MSHATDRRGDFTGQTQTQTMDGRWVPAKPLPYFPGWGERLMCSLGFHFYRLSLRFAQADECFKCNKLRIHKLRK